MTRPTSRAAELLAASALLAGLLPTEIAAWGAVVLGALAFLALAAGPRKPAPARAVVVIAALVALAASAWSLRALPSPDRPLLEAAEIVRGSWSSELSSLTASVDDLPPPGGNYDWLEERQRRLGDRAGIAVLASDGGGALAWAGWSTRLSQEELDAIHRRLARGVAVVVLRRGLTARLVAARPFPGNPDLLLVAERPLAREPDPGFLGGRLPPTLEAFVRWEGFGEGLRGELGSAGGKDEGPISLWSMVPIFEPGGHLLARVSLGLAPEETLRERREAQRRMSIALTALVLFVALAVARPRRYWWTLIPARLALIGAEPLSVEVSWLLTGLMLLGLATLAPLPSRPVARRALLALGAACAVGGLVVTAWGTMHLELFPGDLVLRPVAFVDRGAAALLLVALPWTGLVLALRGLGIGAGRALLVAAACSGLLAGLTHGLSIQAAAKDRVETTLLPQIVERRALWREAILESLEIAIPPPGESVLARDRDAIDLWWNSPLGEYGLASGVWKYDADGAIVDEFITGLPPIVIDPLLAGLEGDALSPYPKRFTPPELVRRPFLGRDFEFLVGETRRPTGGSWVVAVLVEPGNIPARNRNDLLRGARRSLDGLGPLERREETFLAWFDPRGILLHSDLESGPPSPETLAGDPAWRRTIIQGRSADQLEIPGDEVIVTAIVFRPGLLEIGATAIGWCLVLALLAALVRGAAALQQAPLRAWQTLLEGLSRVGNQFRVQVGVALLLAGLLPLLALGTAGRAAARQQGRLQLESAASLSLHTARRLVEDLESLDDSQTLAAGDTSSVSWLARTLGDDIFVWSRGELLASSRPDLVRAGLWPERLPGEVWNALAGERASLILDPFLFETSEASRRLMVAHGPYGETEAASRSLSVPLSRAGRLIAEAQLEVDRALLISAALLLGLTGLLLAPAARRLVRPLDELKQATARLAGGRFDSAIPETGFEETRALSRAFREMAASLATQRRGLERRRAAIETIIASIPLAVVATTREGDVWAANPRAGQLLGVRPDEPFAAPDGELGAAVAAAVDNSGAFERTLDTSEGERSRHYQISGLDLPGMLEGEPLRLVMIEDLTDTVRSQRLTAWAEMARRIAHEIKNPLTPISLVVEHVRVLAERRDPALLDKLDRMLGTIAEQVSVLKETAREFNDYARLLRAVPEPLDLPERIGEWLEAYRMAPPEGRSVTLEGTLEMPPVEGDPRLLRRALVNLVDNAIAAVGPGGRVRVRWSVDGEDALIEVEDDGPGIASDQLLHLFEPDVTTRETGTGLGLPIARQAVEAHGGRIEVDSSPGEGTVFSMRIPFVFAIGSTAEDAP